MFLDFFTSKIFFFVFQELIHELKKIEIFIWNKSVKKSFFNEIGINP